MLHAIILALDLLIGANAAVAQDTPTKTPAAAPQPEQTPASKTPLPGGRISGIVICFDTQKPGRGVGVNIFRAATPSEHDAFRSLAMTDLDGRYQFDHLKPGDYFINVRTNGYLYLRPPDTSQPSNPSVVLPETSFASNKITLHPNETATFDVTLQRGASLSGHVFFDDGSPAMGAEIRVEQIDPGQFYKPEPGAPSYMQITRTGDRGYTDERGYFRITTLGTGTYRIASLPSIQPRTSLFNYDLSKEEQGEYGQPGTLAIFSGDTIHRTQAKIYKLRPGDEVSDIRITIPLTGFYKVHGTVSANDGRTPNEGLLTLVNNADHDIHFRTDLNTDGSFLFAGIPSGTYKLMLSHAYIAKPDTRAPDYSDDDASIETNAFSSVESAIIVKDSDILDLHFEVHEIPMPPKKPDDNDP